MNINDYKKHNSLTKEQKEAVGLLSVGTFLEYFDLMLYVHMAVLLNELFFPKADPYTAKIYSATAFCSTFLFRPIGAYIIGRIGDNIGRRASVILTTVMMSISCLIMANLPTYSQIGIMATWIVTICRILQGMSSMEEVVAAEVYLTESIPLPQRYPVVASITIFSALGGTAALGIAALSTTYGLNWRFAFWVGACIALIGSFARTVLRETPEFIDAKKRLLRDLSQAIDAKYVSTAQLLASDVVQSSVDKKTLLYYFCIQCARPVCFYFTYIYCGNILHDLFHYTSEQVINHAFLISLVDLGGIMLMTYLSSKIYPLFLLKLRLFMSSAVLLLIPYILSHISTPMELFYLQAFFVIFAVDSGPAAAIFYKHFPIFKRFTCAGMTYAISRAFMYIITSFGLVFLVKLYNSWGVLMIMLPVTIGFACALQHFVKLEKESGAYPINY